MIEVYKTSIFEKWFSKLRDHQARYAIAARIDRLRVGHFGDVKPVGGGVSEMRVHCGAGYRIYFVKRRTTLIVLLCGGDKKTQDRDIEQAKSIAATMEF